MNKVAGEIAAGHMHTVRHVDLYDHIGNAWSASMAMMQAKEFKPRRGISPMEFYKNSPLDTPPEELVSEISFIV